MFDTSRIAENLKFYRVAILKKEQKDIIAEVGGSHTSLSRYENGRSLPPIDFLVGFADYANISLDTLVGRNIDSISVEGLTREQMRLMELQAQRYREENKKKGIK